MTGNVASRVPATVIWALGATQIIGYGTLYYAFSVLAPAIGETFGWSSEWVFGALSLSLLAGGLLSPLAGRLADRYGAARIMVVGSILTALTLIATALAPTGPLFALALVCVEMASTLVLYATAFTALVQAGSHGAQRSITHLTLIAGFASTLFWPFTAWLHGFLDWRAVYLVFAALNLFICVPLHLWIARLRPSSASALTSPPSTLRPHVNELPASARPIAFGLLLVGFAIEGFILAGLLMHLVPLLGTLGLGASGVLITTLFGPAQVLSRLINMVFGASLRQTHLGVIAALLLPMGAAILALAPSVAGAMAFAIVFGLGSGLTSIVSGSLPLELFGRDRYGSRLGWLSSARQVVSAVAPFLLATLIGALGALPALWTLVTAGALSTATFTAVAAMAVRSRGAANRATTALQARET